MDDLVRRLPCSEISATNPELLLTREWLVTNGRGGYASGTISGNPTRRYHALLIAALPARLGRMVMLNHLTESIRFPDGVTVRIGGEAQGDWDVMVHGAKNLTEFRLENGLPVWRFEVHGTVLERRLFMPHMQNTVHIMYRLLTAPRPVRLELRPLLRFRRHDAAVNGRLDEPYRLSVAGRRYEVSAGPELPVLRLLLYGEDPSFTVGGGTMHEVYYQVEAERGYDSHGSLWSLGCFGAELQEGGTVTLVASTESWDTIRTLPPEEALTAERERRRCLIGQADAKARAGLPAELVLAADQFLIAPAGRHDEEARARAAGDEVRAVIAGYHWFTDWGRDTMISLEGLTLVSGRRIEGGWILRSLARYVRDGLLPNLIPEGASEGLYHTADATLWFFHALDRYLAATHDRATLEIVLPRLLDIVEHHLRGTRFGIGVDPQDGLLRQGEEGYQLTWMDAKVGDWVVTPRRGKAVEINALWYNALRLLEGWVRELRGEAAARPFAELAERARVSFNQRFWHEAGGYLYDVVDGDHGDDPSCRPNQLLAISLTHPILDRTRWEPVLGVVRERLLTPLGLRSLAPGHPDYKPMYFGDLRARDAVYHQGTVWAWLIGPFIDAWLKLHPDDRAGARRFLEGFVPHLDDACVGSVSEIFDAEAPFAPRGCIAQAWSVAEVLRSWVKTAD